MRKLIFLTLASLLGLGLLTTGAGATLYEFNPTIQVQSYYHSDPTPWNGGNWFNVISDNAPNDVFRIYGANFTGTTLSIFTNWQGAISSDTVNGLTVRASDLFVDTNADGTWDYAIRLQSTGLGNVYKNPLAPGSWFNTSVDICKDTSNIRYGGAYGTPSSPKPIPVFATATTPFQTPPSVNEVTWTPLGGGGNPYSRVDIDLSVLSGFNPNHFAFLYSPAQCGNSVLSGAVPLPPSVLLLGSGLLGLVGLGWRRRRKTA